MTGKSLIDLVAEARARIREITPAELFRWIEDKPDLLIVDVREPDEYARGHLPKSVNIPRGILETSADLVYQKRHPILSRARGRSVVLYCTTGGRSAMGADVLQEMGFIHVANLEGGILEWDAEDFPVVRD
jgi:rhodanese-related sulfurtransferase